MIATDLLQAELDEQRRAVDTDFFDLTLRELTRMVTEGELVTTPEYQRQFRWPEATQSALIESFLLGLPVPPIFVATNPNATWEVVDGLQRVGTVVRFMASEATREAHTRSKDPLRLTGLETLKGFDGLSFNDLSRPMQFLLEKRFVRVQVLNDKSDPAIRYELFRRLNAGAVALTAQEVRACVYRGPFNDMIERLGNDPTFQTLLKLRKADQHNGTRQELALKFFAYLDRAEKFDGRVRDFLNSYMADRAKDDIRISGEEELFHQAVGEISRVCGGRPFLRKGVSWTPQNQLEPALVAAGRILRAGKEVGTPAEDWLRDRK